MKYKLIKTYPGSPKLGTIVQQCEYRDYEWKTFGGFPTRTFSSFEIQNHPEFWQEIVETPKKNWEIIKVKQHPLGAIWVCSKNQSFGISYVGDVFYNNGGAIRGFEVMDKIKNCGWEIYSVKRLSDEETFIIGDKIQDSLTDSLTNYKTQVISGFYISGDNIICTAESGTTMPLDTIRMSKPILTTEDGVNLFCGDEYFRVVSDWTIQQENVIKVGECTYSSDNILRFSTKKSCRKPYH